jgi:hypothetical protein
MQVGLRRQPSAPAGDGVAQVHLQPDALAVLAPVGNARTNSLVNCAIQAGSGSGGRLTRTWLMCCSSVAKASHFAFGCLFARLPAGAAVALFITSRV